MGDLDGDGIGDFAVSSDGAWGWNCDGWGGFPGFVELASGADGSILAHWDAPDTSYWWARCAFGSLEGGGDINGDGVFDLVAGFGGGEYGDFYGFMAVYSGATGTML